MPELPYLEVGRTGKAGVLIVGFFSIGADRQLYLLDWSREIAVVGGFDVAEMLQTADSKPFIYLDIFVRRGDERRKIGVTVELCDLVALFEELGAFSVWERATGS